MKIALLATTFMWATIIALAQVLMGCAPTMRPIDIGRGMSVTDIKIKPNKGPKSVYRVEKYA